MYIPNYLIPFPKEKKHNLKLENFVNQSVNQYVILNETPYRFKTRSWIMRFSIKTLHNACTRFISMLVKRYTRALCATCARLFDQIHMRKRASTEARPVCRAIKLRFEAGNYFVSEIYLPSRRWSCPYLPGDAKLHSRAH